MAAVAPSLEELIHSMAEPVTLLSLRLGLDGSLSSVDVLSNVLSVESLVNNSEVSIEGLTSILEDLLGEGSSLLRCKERVGTIGSLLGNVALSALSGHHAELLEAGQVLAELVNQGEGRVIKVRGGLNSFHSEVTHGVLVILSHTFGQSVGVEAVLNFPVVIFPVPEEANLLSAAVANLLPAVLVIVALLALVAVDPLA